MAKPQIYIFFSDDVREEVGQKISLMGLIGPKLIFFDPKASLNQITLGVLCRFFESGPVPAQLEAYIIDGNGHKISLMPAGEASQLLLEPQDQQSEWTYQIIGKFPLPNIQPGTSIEAVFTCQGEEYKANLSLEGPEASKK